MGIVRRAPGTVENHAETPVTLARINTALFFPNQRYFYADLTHIGLNDFRHRFAERIGANKGQLNSQWLTVFLTNDVARRHKPSRFIQQ
ncbi:hypothetical protein D3C86_1620260 [compost metagenome]